MGAYCVAGAHIHTILEENQEPHLLYSVQRSKDAGTIPIYGEYAEALALQVVLISGIAKH